MLWVSVKLGLRMKTYFFLLFNIVVIFLSESYIFSNTISPYWQVHWFQANSGLHGNSVNIHMYMYVCMYVYSEFSCYHHTIAGNTNSNRFGVRYTSSKKLCFFLPKAMFSAIPPHPIAKCTGFSQIRGEYDTLENATFWVSELLFS